MTRHYVHFSQPALTQLLLNGFEAFVIKHGNKKRSGIEMHASLYGLTEETSTTLHHHVEFVSVDTSAEMAAGWVCNDPAATALKQSLAAAVGYRQLGEMHTHPYLNEEMPLEMVREVGCHFSDGDLEAFKHRLGQMDAGERVIQAVLTIRNQSRQNTQRDGSLADNLFEFSVGNCKCFLLAQVFYLDDSGDLATEPTTLKCEFLQKFHHMTADFGRVLEASEGGRVLMHRP